MSRSNSRGRGRAGQSGGSTNYTRGQRRNIFEDCDVTEQNDNDVSHHYHEASASANAGLANRRPFGHRGQGRGRFPGVFHHENHQTHQVGWKRNSQQQNTESNGELNTAAGQNNEETPANSEACSTIKLRKLLSRDENEVLFKLQTPSFGFVQRLQQGSSNQPMTELLVEVIAKACTSVHQNQLIGLLSKVQNSSFLKNDLLLYLNSFVLEDAMVRPSICCSLIRILRTLTKLFPSKSLTAITVLCAQLKRILSIETPHYNEANNEYRKLLEETADIRKEIQSDVVQRDQERQIHWTVDESEDYRRLSVVPTSEDIRGRGDPHLRENKIYQQYHDSRDYLDVQFRLMKEDLVRPLREGLAELLRNREGGNNGRTKSNMKVYSHVQITSVLCSQHGLIYRIEFDVSRLKHVRWEAGKRLMLGSLVCLSADEFRTMLIATVAERNVTDLSRGVTYLYFDTESIGKKHVKLDEVFEMIESPAYYEPYKCVLQALQKFTDDEKLPFERYLLNKSGEESVPPPKYLTESVKYDFSSLMGRSTVTQSRCAPRKSFSIINFANLDEASHGVVSTLDLSAWPTAEELDLDASQYNALQTAITKEFAVIQGPPGTGKTFIGVKLVQLMLENNNYRRRNLWNGPIMLVCFTNHALDQFLEEIIRIYPTDVDKGLFVRIGGTSKSENEELKKCFLRHIKAKRTSVACNEYRGATIEPREKMEGLEETIMQLSASVELTQKCLMHPDAIRPFARHIQFSNARELLQWLCDKKAEPGTPNLLGADFVVCGDNNQRRKEEKYEDIDLLETEEREQNDNNLDSAEKKLNAAAEAVMAGNTFIKLTGKENKHFKDLYKIAEGIRCRFHQAFKESDDIIAVTNRWQLALADRWRLYNYWTQRFIASKREEMQTLLNDHATEKRKLEEVQDESDYRIFSHAKIIAMTTTGAAKRSDLLKRLAPKIVIVEEAAEVLEAHVVASLSEECEHLILIGDHKQLKPKPADYSLAKRYRLDISLFEKVILNKLHCDRLTIQHRMRPEIVELLVPHIYKSLENHESVLRYENVANVFGNLFFVNHSELENSTDDNRSHSNNHEATFLSELCRYLLNVGYEPKQITILTTYTGQFFLLRKLMPKSEFEGVRITPVDNFQGEENDIILLSLVRSNEETKIGFLKISNRVCVALSRARKGLYIIGNADLLRDESPLWRDILETLKKQNKLVDSLPLGCRKHPEDVIRVKVAEDFKNVPRSGCKYPCDYRLVCGHVCAKLCHEMDSGHVVYKCKKPCPKLCANNTHPCRNLCFENCGDCNELVERTLSRCGHQATMPCYLKEENFECKSHCKLACNAGHACQQLCYEKCKCQIQVTRTLTLCQHEATMPCYLTELEYRCTEPCKKLCPIGHSCNRLCFQTCEPCKVVVLKTLSACMHEAEMPCHFPEQRFKCKERCTKSCPNDHSCEKLCCERCGNCTVPVTKILSLCKHEAVMPCYMNEISYLVDNQCTVEVEKTLPLCGHVIKLHCHLSRGRRYDCTESCKKFCSNGHPCMRKCREPCGHCAIMVEKTLPRCGHKAIMPCHQSVTFYICQIQCDRVCPSGHPCPELCHEKCDDCKVEVEKVLPCCRHKAKMPCYREPSSHQCQLPCERKCPEGHRCRKKCGKDCGPCMIEVQKTLPKCNHVDNVKCHQSPITAMCKLPCKKMLLCGHKCQEICGAVKCTVKCKVSLEKELLCKHMAKMECHQDPSTYVCHWQVKKTLPCDHMISMKCHLDPKDYSCHERVEKKLPCDHVTAMECSKDPTTYLCHERIEVVVCQHGHTKEVDCCAKETKFPPCVEMVKLTCSTGLPNHEFSVQCRSQETTNHTGCRNICDVELGCGHKCTKTCRICVQQGTHGKCTFKCEKQFPLCLHKCQHYCGDQCKACLAESTYICSHRQSHHRCSEKHKFCFRPCDWKCPHYSCTSICSQPCNRPPCNHPCRKPLSCGHVCSGLCGEPCISLCRRRNKDKFYAVAWSPFGKDESSRFLELQPCRHIVEVAAMDKCFLDILTSLPYTLDQRRFLVCPVCSGKVSFCPRYNQYIRRHETQINEALQLVEKSRRLKEIATEYIEEWSKSHHLKPEDRERLFMRSLRQRLRLGALCILQETEKLALQTRKSDFHKTFILSLGSVIERVKKNNFYLDDDKTTTASDTILMYKFYMEAQTYRLASFIRGPKLKVLDKCKEVLQAFESMELVEDNFLRIWEIIEKLNRKLSKKLSAHDRRDDIEDYIDHLNRFYDLELDATLASRWMCCTYGHVYAKNELPNGNRIDALCPYCHPLHNFLLGFLKPDRSSERNLVSKIDTTGYYRQNISNRSASGRQNDTRKEGRRTDPGNEGGASEKSVAPRKTVVSETVIDFNPNGRSTVEFVRGRGRSQGRRGRGRNARGSQVDRNSEYLQSRNEQPLTQTVREPQASVQSPPDTQRMSSESSRSRGRGRGGWLMKGRFGMDQTDQTSTFGELPNSMRDAAASITNVPRGNFRTDKRGFNDRRDSRDIQMSTERHDTQTHRPPYNRYRESPSFWCDTVRTQLENIQTVSNPAFPEKPKNDLEDVVRSQDADTKESPGATVGYGPTQNYSRAKYKQGSRGRRPSRR